MKKSYILIYVCAVSFLGKMHVLAQNIITPQGLMTEEEQRSHWADDSVKKVDIPIGMYGWKIDSRFGDRTAAIPDTLIHHFQNDAFTDGRTGTYNFLGNLGSARESRLFAERRGLDYQKPFIFELPFDFFLKQPEELLYTNTKSPITNLTYHECGNKQNGEDRITALFAVNAGKKLGMGFKLDYLYGRGYYPSQNTAHFNGTLYGSYLGERYEMHTQYYGNHLKQAENGGIENDDYVNRPELFPTKYSPADMPMRLSKAWNKLNVNTFYLTHRYNWGFTRLRNADGVVVRQEKGKLERGWMQKALNIIDSLGNDSLSVIAEEDSLLLSSEFVPVAGVIHTLRIDHNNRRFLSNKAQNSANSIYFADYYLPGDSANDYTKHLHVANTVALEMQEGFSRWAKSGVRLFARYDFNRYTLPEFDLSQKSYMEHHVAVGAQLLKRQGRYFHYDALGEIRTSGDKWGEFDVEGNADLNIPVKKDTLKFLFSGRVCNQEPTFYYLHYHGRNAWWDNGLDNEFRARVGGKLQYKKTSLSVNFETIQNYVYFAEHQSRNGEENNVLYGVGVKQHGKNLQMLSVGLEQNFQWGIFHWDNQLTYQLTSNQDVMPLPVFNAYTNLYLNFRIAKVLNTELGADMRYFTRYYAPTYSPMIGQFCVQDESNRVKIGNYPTVNVYANFHLKHTRFYVMASHVNFKSGVGNPFVLPHYPMNQMVFRLGISWNFFN